MTQDRVRVLVVDDELSIRKPLLEFLPERYDFEVHAAADAGEAMQFIENNRGQYDVALIDRMLEPEPDGIQLMRAIKARYPEIECILATGWGIEDRQVALQEGAFRYLEKPFDTDELAMLMRTAAQQVRLRAINREMLSNRDLAGVLGHITAAVRSLAQVDEAEIVLLNEATDSLRSYGWPAAAGDGGQEGRDAIEKLTRQVLATGQTVAFADLSAEPSLHWLAAQGIQSLIGVPIPSEAGSLGALVAYSRRSAHFARGSDVVLLQTLAGQAGLAIANARAFEDTTTYAGYMKALVEVTGKLTQTSDQDEQLQLAWDFVREQLGMATFIVGLIDRRNDMVNFPVFYDGGRHVPQPPMSMERAAKGTIIGAVIADGKEFFAPTGQAREEQCAFLGITSTAVGIPCETCLYLPLNVGGEVLGAITVQAYEPYAFSPVFRAAFRALANHLAVALSNGRLVTNTQRQAKDLQTLLALSRDVAASLKVQQVLELICHAAVDFFRADHSGLLWIDGSGEFGEVVAEYPGGLGTTHLRVPLRGVADEEKLLNLRQPLVINRVADRDTLGPVKDILLGLNILSTLIIPVIIKGVVIGSISIDAIGRERHFEDQEIELAKAFAAQVAVSVEHAQLFAESESRARLLAALDEATRHIRGVKDPQRLMHEVVRLAAELVGCQHGCLLAYEHHLRRLKSQAIYGLPERLLNVDIRDDNGIVGQTIKTGQSCSCPDYRHSPVRDSLFEGLDLEYTLAIPLRSTDGDVDAVLYLADSAPRFKLEPPAIEALERFASTAAIALSTSQSLTSEQRSIEQQKVLHKISEYIQESEDEQKIYHAILTGVTAGYGLGINRSALLLLDEAGDLVGRMGIGNFDDAKQRGEWLIDQQQNQNNFQSYQVRLEGDKLEQSPVEKAIVGLRLPRGSQGALATILKKKHYRVITKQGKAYLPPAFIEAFQPAFPLIVVALIARGQPIGLIIADNKVTNEPISDELVQALLTYVNTVSIAIENRRLMKSNEDKLAQVQQTREAARVVAEAVVQRDLHQTLSEIATRTRSIMKADAVTLYAYHESTGRFTEWGTDNPEVHDHRALVKPEELKSQTSSPYKLLRLEVKPYYRLAETDLQADDVLGGYYVGVEDIQSAIGIQLRATGRKMGVMYVNFRTPHRFSLDELSTIQLFADQAAAAIRIKQLYDEANHRAEQSHLVAEIGREASSLELQYFLGSLLGRLVKLFGDRRIPVYLSLGVYNAENRTLELIPTPYYPTEIRTRVQSVDARNIMARVAKHRAPLYAPDVDKEEQYNQLIADTRSEYALPILFGDDLLGVLDLQSPELNAFSKEDRELLDTIANQIASALHNVRQYEELKQTKGLVGTRTALAWMGMIAGVYRHEMGNSLTVIKERVGLLRNDLAPYMTDGLGEHLDAMERVALRMQRIPLAPPLSAEQGSVLVPLCESLRSRMEQLQKRDTFKGIACEVNCGDVDGCVVRASPDWIKRLIDLLTHNAATAMANSVTKKLMVNAYRDDGLLEVTVQDTGPGIPEWQREYLFKQPIPKKPGEDGSGMGLLIAQLIAETYGGGISCDDTNDDGTTMRFWFPIEE